MELSLIGNNILASIIQPLKFAATIAKATARLICNSILILTQFAWGQTDILILHKSLTQFLKLYFNLVCNNNNRAIILLENIY